VNSVAQAAAVASLRDAAELKERVDALVAERARVAETLEEQGWKLPVSEANFLWFPLGPDSTDFSLACHEAGLMVRQYGDDGVRVTIGEVEANDRLIEVCREFGPR
jgi:histidinol-phosphate aminotransferase